MTSLKFYNAIMMSVMKNGQWSEPINITAQIGSDGDCEPSCISFDNKTLYLIRKQKGNNDIYYSEFNGTNWSIMQPLNKNINSNKNESAACISPDGKVLYFSSDRKGGFGNLDLYMSVLDINNEWGPAINLGKNINTPYNDTNPYVCEDGKTFFFCSEGHLNMGGYDIFVTTIFPNYKFDMPINIGYPINTTHDNYYFYPVKNGEFIYLSLIRDEGYGDQDIYKAENISFSKIYKDNPGIVSNAKKVVIRNKITNDIVGYLFGE